jgi:hypothetical protein
MMRAKSTEAADRRLRPRSSVLRVVRLAFEPGEFQGSSANVSSDGLYFFAEGSVRVTLRLEGGRTPVEAKGRLVRAESVNPTKVGFAVRFDEPLDLGRLE